MIISLFGPDGVGKSTLSQKWAEDGWFVFSGTGVASWPDQTWYNELVARGIDESTYDNDEHFLEKIVRAHELARRLEQRYGRVIIDSDPLHKTLMHDEKRGKKRFHELHKLAFPEASKNSHVCVLLDSGDDMADARELQRRIAERGKFEHFDPKSIDASFESINACRRLCSQLRTIGDTVKVTTPQQSLELDYANISI